MSDDDNITPEEASELLDWLEECGGFGDESLFCDERPVLYAAVEKLRAIKERA